MFGSSDAARERWPGVFQDPDNVGETEYRAIFEAVSDALDDGADDALVLAMLQNFEETARSLRERLAAAGIEA